MAVLRKALPALAIFFFSIWVPLRIDESAEPVSWADALVFVALGLLALWALTSQRAIRKLPHNRPKLTPEPPDGTHSVGFPFQADGERTMVAYRLLAVPFYNARRGGPLSATASNVTALVEAFDSQGTRVHHTHGHWRSIEEPQPPNWTEPQRVTIRPDGQRFVLDVVARDEYEPMESFDAHLATPILGTCFMYGGRLPPGTYGIRITLTPDGRRSSSFEYELWNPGQRGQRMTLRRKVRRLFFRTALEEQHSSVPASRDVVVLDASARRTDAAPLRLAVNELAAIVEEGEKVRGDAFTDPAWDEYLCWKKSAAGFLATVFGTDVRDRLTRQNEAENTSALVGKCLNALREIMDEPPELQADAFEVQKAIERRRAAPKGAMEAAFAHPDEEADAAPRLSFGRPVIPHESQRIELPNGTVLSGRVVRIPVTNAHGAGTAKRVHARLAFMPDDVHRTFAPPHPAQGEWYRETGQGEVEIDIPGNGRPRLLDVFVAIEEMLPHAGHAYEWTVHSRAANLLGYEIKATRFDTEVEVVGANTPRLRKRLETEFSSGMLRAEWVGENIHEATNYSPWKPRPGRPNGAAGRSLRPGGR